MGEGQKVSLLGLESTWGEEMQSQNRDLWSWKNNNPKTIEPPFPKIFITIQTTLAVCDSPTFAGVWGFGERWGIKP